MSEGISRVELFNKLARVPIGQYAVDERTQIYSIINKMEGYDIARWISCSERLPEEYANYLVCYEDGECFVCWLEDADWARGVIEKEGIVAWMPLPQPYSIESK